MAGFPFVSEGVNQNSQTDQSQAGIDVNRRKPDQANVWRGMLQNAHSSRQSHEIMSLLTLHVCLEDCSLLAKVNKLMIFVRLSRMQLSQLIILIIHMGWLFI